MKVGLSQCSTNALTYDKLLFQLIIDVVVAGLITGLYRIPKDRFLLGTTGTRTASNL